MKNAICMCFTVNAIIMLIKNNSLIKLVGGVVKQNLLDLHVLQIILSKAQHAGK